MDSLKAEFSTRQKQRFLITSITVVVALVALVAAVILFRQTDKVLERKIQFDPAKNIRMFDVSRVYAIEYAPLDSEKIWFCTAEGIRVLNNVTMVWKRYGMDHGLLSETVSDICFDREGTPWVGTWNGIARFDSVSGKFHHVRTEPGLGGERVLAIESLGSAGIFYSLDGRGVFVIDSAGAAPRRLSLPGVKKPGRVTCLTTWNDQLLIGAEDRRVICYDPRSRTTTEMSFERGGAKKTVVWDIASLNGNLYIATSDDGIWRSVSIQDTLREIKGFPAKGAYKFAAEQDGFWVGTPFGLWRHYYDGETWLQYVHPEEKSPDDFQVFSLFNTPDVLWYGSMELGVGYLVKNKAEWRPLRAGLTNPNVTAMASSGGVLWTAYGYQGGHIDAFTSHDVQYSRNYGHFDGIKDGQIQVLFADGDTVYFGGYTSFGYLDKERGLRRFYNEDSGLPYTDIAAIVRSNRGTLLLGGLFGLIEFDRKAGTFKALPDAQGSRITSLLSEDDSVWCGTLAHGVFLYNTRTGKVTTRLVQGTGRITGIRRVLSAEGTMLVIGTKDDGVYRVSYPYTKVQRLELPDGMIEGSWSDQVNHIVAMSAIDSRIWLGTRGAGCLIFDGRSGTWRKLTYYEGLVSDQVRSFTDDSAYVWIGCYGGLNRIEKTHVYSGE